MLNKLLVGHCHSANCCLGWTRNSLFIMGNSNSRLQEELDAALGEGQVDLRLFNVMHTLGKGAFGKVLKLMTGGYDPT